MATLIFHLNDDVLFYILSKTTIKELMQIRCVSKSLRSIIDSPSFAKFHLSHSLQEEHYALHLEAGKLRILSGGTENYLESLDFSTPWLKAVAYHNLCDLHSPCNGLLLFTCKSKSCFVVVNPSREGKIMLPKVNDEPQCSRRICGFGYDNVTNKFKVVCVQEYETCGEKKTLVHTLGTRSWREIGESPPCPLSDDKSVYANGFLHWLGRSRDIIVSFDVDKEKFGFTAHPFEVRPGESSKLGLVILKGKLGLTDCCSSDGKIVIWELKEEDSNIWTQEYIIRTDTIWAKYGEAWDRLQGMGGNGYIFSDSDIIKVKGLWKEGEILLHVGEELFLIYSVESQRTRMHQLRLKGSADKVVCYQPSLISLHSI